MSENDRHAQQQRAEEAFNSEKERAASLLRAAADHLESAAKPFAGYEQAFALPQPEFGCRTATEAWSYDNVDRNASSKVWIEMLSPVVAPWLAGWLRKVALIAASQQNRDAFSLYVDRKALSLAEHITAVARRADR